MSQLGSITAEKEKQMDLERQRFQEVKAKMLAQQKYKRAARTAGHIVLNIVVALIVLLPLLYAVSIAFMPSGELFTLDMNILPKHPTLENFRQALQKVPLVRFVSGIRICQINRRLEQPSIFADSYSEIGNVR